MLSADVAAALVDIGTLLLQATCSIFHIPCA